MTLYLLPDGSLVPVDSTAAKDAPVIDYTLKGGQIVQAKRVEPASYAVRKALREATLAVGREVSGPYQDREQLAQTIAKAISANCDAYHDGQIDQATWDAEQVRLWRQAGEAFCASVVMRILFPSVGWSQTGQGAAAGRGAL